MDILGRCISGLVLGGFRKGSVLFSISQWIVIQTMVWAPLSMSCLTTGQSACILSPKTSLFWGHSSSYSRCSIGRYRVPFHPRGRPQDTPLEALTTGLIEDKRDAPSHPGNSGHHKLPGSGPCHHTNSQHPKRHGLFLLKCKKHTRIIPATFSVKFTCFGRLPCDFSYWHVYIEAWSCNFPLLSILFRGDIRGHRIWLNADGPGVMDWALEWGVSNRH